MVVIWFMECLPAAFIRLLWIPLFIVHTLLHYIALYAAVIAAGALALCKLTHYLCRDYMYSLI